MTASQYSPKARHFAGLLTVFDISKANFMTFHYDINRRWSDRFLPDIKRLIGSHLLSTAPDPLDQLHATDLLMLDARDMRIAARVRRPGYALRYPHQFTIRSHVPSGAETELSKIVNGYGDWMFYGHVSASQTHIEHWRLIDLRAFRAALIRHANGGQQLVMGDQANPDGTWFKWFDIRSFPAAPPLVVATSPYRGR
ncbi:hypothetical protein [Sedimentitalea nanhaiensis]|uniref:hypothetical protein n=1 Tax=Sedimentitalea nanhaiensis TaxID=999627 RepID=UPI001FE0E9B9|nr:hypothetical protein [Sedimentitalea nanhaiensis]